MKEGEVNDECYYDDEGGYDEGAPSPQTEKQMEYLRNLQQRQGLFHLS